jgi:hypothetical protein
LRDPVAGDLQRLRREPAAALPPHLAIGDEPGAPEHTDMLEERRQRHSVRAGELPDRGLAVHQLFQDGPPDGVGEGGEGLIETGAIVNHVV